MKTVVMKFGGAAVATPACFAKIADIILQRSLHYDRIAVVVSAMGNTTDQLIALARQVHPNPPSREYDMLISIGERMSMALLAMALSLKNKEACSFTGSQSGIITSSNHTQAQIINVRPKRLLPYLEQGKIVIVAGFQGVSMYGEITTLGRGGSDTTAVALAIALDAEKVEFYKNVIGIFDIDPHTNPTAQVYEQLDYQKALDLAMNGAKILQSRAVTLAMKNAMPLHVLSFDHAFDTNYPGTWVVDASLSKPLEPIYEQNVLHETDQSIMVMN